MELIITLYQEKVDQALIEMQKARQEYENAQDTYLLKISLEYEIRAHYYLILAEQALEFI